MPSYSNLVTFRLVNDFGLLLLIWMVQLIIYPAFERIQRDRFRSWHTNYTGLITIFVVPLMFCQVALIGYELVYFFSWKTCCSALVVTVCWTSTFALSVPLHSQLQALGNQSPIAKRLVSTNWIRTIGWSFVFCLTVYSWWQSAGLAIVP